MAHRADMNRMKVLLVVGSLTGVAACSTVTRSNAEFVRDLHIDGGHLVVETCRAEYAIDHHEGAKVATIAPGNASA